jgi:hypothetical protein
MRLSPNTSEKRKSFNTSLRAISFIDSGLRAVLSTYFAGNVAHCR